MKIEIYVSKDVEYDKFWEYHKHPILTNSEDTYNNLILYTRGLIGICKLFLPENGIHISKQQDMIEDILQNKNITELYIFTHSPSVFGKGWGSSVVFI